MTFQPNVFIDPGFDVPGEIYSDSPTRSQSYILQSADPAYNVIGATVFTIVSEGIVQAGGTGVIAGFLAMPKTYALPGAGGQPLAPTLVLPNETQAEIVSMGDLVVTIPTPAGIGFFIAFDEITGALSTYPQGGGIPAGLRYSNAFIGYFAPTVPGLAVATINPVEVTI